MLAPFFPIAILFLLPYLQNFQKGKIPPSPNQNKKIETNISQILIFSSYLLNKKRTTKKKLSTKILQPNLAKSSISSFSTPPLYLVPYAWLVLVVAAAPRVSPKWWRRHRCCDVEVEAVKALERVSAPPPCGPRMVRGWWAMVSCWARFNLLGFLREVTQWQVKVKKKSANFFLVENGDESYGRK